MLASALSVGLVAQMAAASPPEAPAWEPPPDLIAGRAQFGLRALRSFGADSDDSLPFLFGAQAAGRGVAYLDPLALHGELGLSFYGEQNCPEDCLPAGELRASFTMGPAYAPSDRTRLSVRLGGAAHVLGRGAYTAMLLEAPKVELGWATWSAPHEAFPNVSDSAGIDLLDVTLSAGLLLSGDAESSGAEPSRSLGPTVGAGVLGVLGPMSLEARANVAPSDRPLILGETQVCVGTYSMACLGFEAVYAELVHETSPSDRLLGGTVMVTVGAGFVGAVGGNEPR